MSEIEQVGHVTDQQKVLRSVAEDLKAPLLRILAETQLHDNNQEIDRAFIETTAQSAMRLIDSYIISTKIYSGQQRLDLEPISVVAVMNDAAHYLDKLARLYGCSIELQTPRSTRLVMANADALLAAMTSLGYSFLNAIVPRSRKKNVLLLTAKNTVDGVGAGIFSPYFALSTYNLRQARRLAGNATVALPQLGHGSNAGVMIADTLVEAMSYHLTAARRASLNGLTIKLMSSYQMSLL